AAQQAEAILLVGGGLTSHVAIIARSMQIPMVMSSEKRLLTLNAETMLLVDGDQGHVHVDPRPEVVENFKALEKAQRDAPALARRMMPETVTRDGARIMLMANVNLLSELAMVRQFGADGVGLYRSEFPFIARNDFPSEEEQYRLYRRIFDETDGMPVVFRTLDVGGDKMLSYFQNVSEANPFLGLRAIRFSLRNKDVFCCQLRAMLRAGLGARLRIMFPLVSSVDDFEQARSVVFECAGQLRAEGVPHNASPELGAMIELPSAVAVAAELARAADFLSIGSNDLIQYILAVDRTNQHISDLFIPHHPAVLRSMARVVHAARDCGKPVSLCGEMAANPAFARFLIGIGLRSFSMEVRSLPAIQKSMTEVNAAEAEQFAGDVLRLARIRDVAERLGLPR
ncbi:MAG: phosphoenolpyruvate--protein phosphotransferase, partial [Lentisphaerae bacterium]|nr:phosphoenolpyruvate--protein phosphotransferase [Lentisphaerota bacterium]